MKLTNLHDLFVDQLHDIYNAESQITKALPKMMKSASSPELRETFQHHLSQTQSQIERLEQIFTGIGAKPGSKKCKGMEGLLEEGKELMAEDITPQVMDAALIATAQRVKHYEISAYGTARTFAEQLGHKDAANLLQTTLDEESQTDHRLTEIAQSWVNEKAAHGVV
ncbi:MAG: ferritin-like domain-containing protein [Ignavibacteriae bacterium]|nr:ferritin-like domain-containing protein [Ignavibacteriota bacterium]